MALNPTVSISADSLRAELLKRKYEVLLEKPEVFPSQKNWEYISEHGMAGKIGRLLFRKYIVAVLTPTVDRVDSHLLALREFPKYLASLPLQARIDIIYSDTDSIPEETFKLAEKNQLFSCDAVYSMIEDGRLDKAIKYLGLFKPDYNNSDYIKMKGLVRRLRSLPELGCVQATRGLFSSGVKYICPDGHSNSPDTRFCEHPGCGKDIYGLTKPMYDAIEAFENLTEVLGEMLHTS